MTWILLHRSDDLLLACNEPVVAAADLGPLETALDLLREAEAVLGRAEAEALQARNRARAEGHADGLAAGRAAAGAELDRLSADLAAAADRETAGLVRQLSELALAVVEHIAGAIGPSDFVAALARQAAETMLADARARLRVAPQAAAAVADALAGNPGIAIVPDQALAATDCRFETEQGTIDAGLGTQLAAVGRLWSGR